MTTNIILFCFVLVLLLLLILILMIKDFVDKFNADKKNKSIVVSLCLALGLAFIVFSFFAPYIFTNTTIGKTIITGEATGLIGDTMGGVMNPFIAIAGVILTFLAFYIQFKANKQVQGEFRIQQFESQFYERLRLIKEEINTIYLPLRNGETLLGRQVFYEMDKEIKMIYFLVNNLLNTDDLKAKFEITYYIFYKGRLKYFDRINHFSEKFNLERESLLNIELFLSSIYEFLKSNIYEEIDEERELILDSLDEFIKEGGKLSDFLNVDLNYFYAYLLLKDTENLNLNHVPFKGMETKLSLILRQLFSLVKFVTKENLFTYEEMRNYLRVLRSILSNYEQLHIFYNWFSGTGAAWEDHNNKFLTDYRMIHNLPPDFLITGFDLEAIFGNRPFRYEENRKSEDSLFEQIDIYND